MDGVREDVCYSRAAYPATFILGHFPLQYIFSWTLDVLERSVLFLCNHLLSVIASMENAYRTRLRA